MTDGKTKGEVIDVMAATKVKHLMADFETTVDPDDLRTWAVCAVDIETNEVEHLGTSIEEFFDYLKDKNTQCSFHNLRFDGEFILYHLLTNGYKLLTPDKDGRRPKPEAKSFETLITDMGMFYSITVYFSVTNKKYKKVVFLDSLKKLPFKVSEIAGAFKLPLSKLSIDYEEKRPVGHELTKEEREYILADCHIVAQALNIQRSQGLKKMTISGDAMGNIKSLIGAKNFEKLFPVLPLDLDKDLRRAYRGGFTYLKKGMEGARGIKGLTLDVNSLYPAMMKYKALPWGYPRSFEGEPNMEELGAYNLYIVKVRAAFTLKKDHIPTLQLKGNPRFISTQYIENSGYTDGTLDYAEMVLTSVDLQLLKDHYDIVDIEYLNGWAFKSRAGIFDEFIDYWMEIKANNKGAMRTLAKLMLNSSYGRFAANPKRVQKIPYLDEDGVVSYYHSEPVYEDPVYVPVAAFITALARETTVRAAQKVYDRFIYADTDSLHLIGQDIPEGLEVHPTKLGAWKHEGNFDDSCFIRPKTYMETMHSIKEDTLETYVKAMESADVCYREADGIHVYETHVTCAGMPENVKETVTYENFHRGASFYGKLVPKRHKGGVVLTPTYFTIS